MASGIARSIVIGFLLALSAAGWSGGAVTAAGPPATRAAHPLVHPAAQHAAATPRVPTASHHIGLVSRSLLYSTSPAVRHSAAAPRPARVSHTVHLASRPLLHRTFGHPTPGMRWLYAANFMRVLEHKLHLPSQSGGPRTQSCPANGTWPGPNGPSFLNQFNDGNCGFFIGSNAFPNSGTTNPYTFQPDGSGQLHMQAPVTIAAGDTVTMPTGATLIETTGADFTVDGTLDMQAGTGMELTSGSWVLVQSGGTLNASGTASTSGHNVVFTSANATPAAGDWSRIEFDAGSAGTLDFASVQDAGSGRCGGSGCPSTSIQLVGATPTIENTTIGTGSGNGIQMSNGSLPTLTSDTVTGVTGSAFRYDSLPNDLSSVSGLSASSDGANAVTTPGGNIGTSGTWQNVGIPIAVDGGSDISVNAGAVWTLTNGTVVQLNPSDAIFVNGPNGATPAGELDACKTCTSGESVTFEGTAAVAGTWGRIEYQNGATGTLNHVLIEDAGAGRCGSNGCPATSIQTTNGSAPTIENSTITTGNGNGIEITGGGAPTLTSDTVNGVSGNAIRYDNLQPDLTNVTGLNLSNNGLNAISMAGGNVSANGTWQNTGPSGTTVPIQVDQNSDISILAGMTWTIDAGTVVQFPGGSNNAIFVNGPSGATPAATLNASGTSTSPVTFQSTTNAAGNWGRIEFQNGAGGTLNFVQIKDAGVGRCGSNGCPGTNIQTTNGSAPTIENTTITTGSGNGIEITGGGAPTLTSDTITSVTGAAVRYDSIQADLSNVTGLSLSSNGTNAISMAGGTFGANGAWSNTGATGTNVPVQVDSNSDITVPSGVTWTIKPGTVVQFPGGSNNAIFVSGTLLAQGTGTGSSQIITFQSTTNAAGNWGRIEIQSGSGNTSKLNFVQIKDAGVGRCGSNGCPSTSIQVVNGAAPTISNTTVSTGTGNGIEMSGGSLPTLTADTVTGVSGDAFRYDSFAPDLTGVTGLKASGDGLNGISMAVGTDGTTGTWPALSVPVVMDNGDISVSSGVTWTVDGGDTIKLGGGGAIFVSGTLNMPGTLTKNVVLTSNSATPGPGNWGRIEFDSGSAGALTFVQISDAGAGRCGGSGCPATSIQTVNGASPTITNTTIQKSGGNDVEITGGGSPVLHFDTFLAVPSGSFGVVNDSGGSCNVAGVDATHDFWGSNTGPTSSCNTGGTGTPVSNGVAFAPFLSLSVAPTGGAQSSTASVSGTGFAANETVTLKWNCPTIVCPSGTTLTTVAADANGSFSNVSVTIPANATVGKYSIGALGGTSSGFVTTTFTVKPTFKLTPGSGAQGGTTTASGTGFGPNETVTILWNCATVTCSGATTLTTVTTDANGDFSGLSVTAPSTATVGTYSVGAKGSVSSIDFAKATFTVKPTLKLSPAAGAQGSTTTASGTGFGPSETVTLLWNCSAFNCSGATTLTTVTTDANGDFSGLSITVPSSATVGTYTVGAQGSVSSADFAKATFAVKPTLSISPTSGAPGSPATVSGTGYHPNQSVTIIWNCSSPSCTSTIDLGTATADANGDFSSFSVTIPSTSSAGTFSVGGKDTSGAFASTKYKVT